MKKISLLLTLLLVVSMADAQRISDKWSFEKRDITYKLSEAAANTHLAPANNVERGVSIWTEDFSGAVNGPGTVTTDVGVWTIGGDDGNIWRHSTTQSNGCWSGGTGLPGFASAGNGFLIFDADSANCIDPDAPGGPDFTQTEWSGFIESPSIDLSGQAGVSLKFAHEYRWCCTDLAIEVAVSADGGLTYTTAPSYVIPAEAVNVQFVGDGIWNISAVAGGSDDVKIRFSWNGPSHYYWVLDDLELFVPESNDLAVIDAGYSNWNPNVATDYIDLEYSIYPQQQLRPIDFTSRVVNNGSVMQTGVTLNATVNYDGGTAMLSSNPIDLAPGEDSLLVIEDWTPPAGVLGEYITSLEVTQNETDIDPSDQLNEVIFWAENDIMARDRRSAEASYTNTGDAGHTLGTAYGCSDDASVYAIGVAMSTASDDASEFTVELWGDGATDFEFLVGGNEDLTYQNSMGNGTGDEFMTYILLEDPYDIEEGLDYYAHFKAYGGDGNEAFIRTSGVSPEQTSFVFIEEDDTWFFTTGTPMVRLGFAEDVSIAEATISDRVSLGQNVPNPVKDITTIAYDLVNAETVLFEVYDLTGKVVMNINEGRKAAGRHSIVVSNEDLNSGIYYYSIIIDGDRLTKKMVITK
ncbi:MAG: T9SS type A sorting domain-containing protein [Flavobacteriales bacterium]|nr:T9SS type A sorting domain-containing protein [Flavobacteriales bacterium]